MLINVSWNIYHKYQLFFYWPVEPWIKVRCKLKALAASLVALSLRYFNIPNTLIVIFAQLRCPAAQKNEEQATTCSAPPGKHYEVSSPHKATPCHGHWLTVTVTSLCKASREGLWIDILNIESEIHTWKKKKNLLSEGKRRICSKYQASLLRQSRSKRKKRF